MPIWFFHDDQYFFFKGVIHYLNTHTQTYISWCNCFVTINHYLIFIVPWYHGTTGLLRIFSPDHSSNVKKLYLKIILTPFHTKSYYLNKKTVINNN